MTVRFPNPYQGAPARAMGYQGDVGPLDLQPPLITLSGDVTGSGTGSIVVELSDTGVVAGSYTNSNLTVDEDGRITAAANGSASAVTPGGSTTQVQYNNVSAFGGSAGATFDATSLKSMNIALGSDGIGDIYYRNISGNLTRRGIGTSGYVLSVVGGVPDWRAITGTTGAATVVSSTSATRGSGRVAVWDADGNLVDSGVTAGNQTITITGDVDGTGTTAITLTLDTVNSNVGTFASHTVNGKGLTTAAGNLTGDVTTSGAATAIANGAVTYAKQQNVAAARLIGNPTGSLAAHSEISLGTGLSFSGAVLNATVGAGTVTSIAAGTGLTASPSPITGTGTMSLTVPVSVANGGTNATNAATGLANLGGAPLASPNFATSISLNSINIFTGRGKGTATQSGTYTTTSSTGVMLGLACSCTPALDGAVHVNLTGAWYSGNSATQALYQLRGGTGTAPTQGAASTGTSYGQGVTPNNTGYGINTEVPFSLTALATGLTIGTAYWFDLFVATQSGSNNINTLQLTMTAIEI